MPGIDPSSEVVVETRATVPTGAVVALAASHTSTDVSSPFALVVPGRQATLAASSDQRLIDCVATAARTAEIATSLCSAVLILASPALVDDVLEHLGARQVHRRWVEDGKFLTPGGISAGIERRPL